MMQIRFGYNQGSRPSISRRNRLAILLAGAAALAVAHSGPGFAAGDAARGEVVYRDCMICHALDRNEVGPMHRNLFGRKAGAVQGYDYSAALKAANIVWNEATLDQWLTDPQAVVPGTKMTFWLDDPHDRADVIAFLKEKAASRPSATAGAR